MELLVTVAIAALLAALLLPAAEKAVAIARSAQCLSNLRQIHAGVILYAGENGGWLPPNQLDTGTGAWWKQVYPQYVPDIAVFKCPEDKTGGADLSIPGNAKLSYGAMGDDQPGVRQGVMDKNLASFTKPAGAVMLIDDAVATRQMAKSWFYCWPQYTSKLKAAHGGKLNLIFVDGHEASMTVDQINRGVSANTIRVSFGDYPSRFP